MSHFLTNINSISYNFNDSNEILFSQHEPRHEVLENLPSEIPTRKAKIGIVAIVCLCVRGFTFRSTIFQSFWDGFLGLKSACSYREPIAIVLILVKETSHCAIQAGERGGLVVEGQTPEREVGGSKPTFTVLCP